MAAYMEAPADDFDYDEDWKELIASGESPSSSRLSNDTQDATLVGLVPWNKQRSCAKYFLGHSECDTDAPYRLYRVNPQPHPLFPWLFAADISFTPFVPKSNPDAVNDAPHIESVFDDRQKIAYHEHVIATVRFRAFRFRYQSDGRITTNQDEWKRNTFFDVEPSIEALQVTGGLSQLIFAETAAGGPTVGTTRFGAPLAALLSKASILCTWVNVPWEYLSKADYYFWPEKILQFVGTVNSEVMFSDGVNQFNPGTLLFQPPRWSIKAAPIASNDIRDPLRYVDVQLRWDYFNPEKGKASVYYGHNLMPWSGDGGPTAGDGKFYMATRNGALTGVLTTEKSLLRYADHREVFENVRE